MRSVSRSVVERCCVCPSQKNTSLDFSGSSVLRLQPLWETPWLYCKTAAAATFPFKPTASLPFYLHTPTLLHVKVPPLIAAKNSIQGITRSGNFIAPPYMGAQDVSFCSQKWRCAGKGFGKILLSWSDSSCVSLKKQGCWAGTCSILEICACEKWIPMLRDKAPVNLGDPTDLRPTASFSFWLMPTRSRFQSNTKVSSLWS